MAEQTSTAGLHVTPGPLPQHLFYGDRREEYVVFAWDPHVGWWRRHGTFPPGQQAYNSAKALNSTGTATIVAKQEVTKLPFVIVAQMTPAATRGGSDA